MSVKLGRERWENFLRESLVAGGLVAGFVIVYLPGILLNTIGTSDDHKIFWVDDTKQCCFSAWDSQNWSYIGRAIGSLLANIQFGFIRELGDLIPLRIFSAVCTALGCFGIYRYLRRELEMVPALMVAVGICMVPAFFLGVVWAHAFAFITIPPFLAFWAGIVAVDRPKYFGGRIGSALIAGFIFFVTLYMYQPSAMFFVLPMILSIFFFRKFPEHFILARVFWIFGIFVGTSAIYYVIHRYVFLPRFIATYPSWADESSHARFVLFGAEGTAGLMRELARKADDLSIMTLIAFNGVWPVPRRSIAFVVTLVILAGIVFFGWRDREGAVSARRVTWRSILATSLLALLTTAPTIAAAGGYTPVRIASAYAAIVVSALLWAVFRIFGGHREVIAGIAILASITLIPLVQNLALLSNATARVTYDTTKALLSTYLSHPIATVWVLWPEQRSNNPFGMLAGHEITSVSVSKLSVDLVLAELGYRHGPGFRYREVRSAIEEVGLSERDAVVDLRFLDRDVPNAFQQFRLDQATQIQVTGGRCEPDARARSLTPPLAEPGWTSSYVEAEPWPAGAEGVRVQVAGESPLQRLSRRVLVPRGRVGDRLQARVSVNPGEGVERTGLRFTLLPDVAQMFADATVKPGRWQCATITFVSPVDFDYADFFIYPTTTSSDRGPARPGLKANLADLQIVHISRVRQSDLLPLRRLWRLRSVDRRDEAIEQTTRLLDNRAETVWRIRDRPTAGLLVELPEAPAVLTGIRLIAPEGKAIRPPTAISISGSDDGITWTPLASASIDQGVERGMPRVVPVSPARPFRLISLTFSGGAPEWGLGEIAPEFAWN